MQTIRIEYCFRLVGHPAEVFEVVLNEQSLEMRSNPSTIGPPWARLDFHQCPECSLELSAHPYCPVAASLARMLPRFDKILRQEKVDIEVTTGDRKLSVHIASGKGISSLMGLVMATCGCPQTAFFKPMARFHLPFAEEDETIYRATSMYLLAQYFRGNEGQSADFGLRGLQRIYDRVHQVNQAFATRLREAGGHGSSLSALTKLDRFTAFVPIAINASLARVRHLFSAYLGAHEGRPLPRTTGRHEESRAGWRSARREPERLGVGTCS